MSRFKETEDALAEATAAVEAARRAQKEAQAAHQESIDAEVAANNAILERYGHRLEPYEAGVLSDGRILIHWGDDELGPAAFGIVEPKFVVTHSTEPDTAEPAETPQHLSVVRNVDAIEVYDGEVQVCTFRFINGRWRTGASHLICAEPLMSLFGRDIPEGTQRYRVTVKDGWAYYDSATRRCEFATKWPAGKIAEVVVTNVAEKALSTDTWKATFWGRDGAMKSFRFADGAFIMDLQAADPAWAEKLINQIHTEAIVTLCRVTVSVEHSARGCWLAFEYE